MPDDCQCLPCRVRRGDDFLSTVESPEWKQGLAVPDEDVARDVRLERAADRAVSQEAINGRLRDFKDEHVHEPSEKEFRDQLVAEAQFRVPGSNPSPAGSHLPDSAARRKLIPLATGLIDYFPDALIAVASLSRIGNEQHNPGKPLHWDRSKSGDESDCLLRHFIDRGTLDTDGVRHSVKVAWRALALLQKELEATR